MRVLTAIQKTIDVTDEIDAELEDWPWSITEVEEVWEGPLRERNQFESRALRRLRGMRRCGRLPVMISEARLESTEYGFVPAGDGWFVLNAREAPWRSASGRGAISVFEGEQEFSQLGIHLFVLGPGEPMAMYHWEVDQEDFLVLAGEALLIVEGEERPLRQWDFVHCPAGTKHVIVGAGDGPCVVLAVGARGERSSGPDWGGYSVDEAALRHSAGVEQETTDQFEAYERVARREHTRYREGWLPK